MKKKILIVEDDRSIREMLRFILERAGHAVLEAHNCQQAKIQVTTKPDLIILDWMLPDGSGINLAKQLKNHEQNANIPVIMLTARAEEEDKVQALELAVDDYLTKPFSPRELIARIQAHLRRTAPSSAKIILLNKLAIDTSRHQALYHHQPLKLTPIEFRLLHFFATHLNRVYSRGQIVNYVWGETTYIDERTVDVQIRRLRQALRDTGLKSFIETVRGVGYIANDKG